MAVLLQRERRRRKSPPRISNVSLPKKKHNPPPSGLFCVEYKGFARKRSRESFSRRSNVSPKRSETPRKSQKKKTGERRESLFARGDGGGDARDPCERDPTRGGAVAGGGRAAAEAETGRGGTPPTLNVAVAVVHPAGTTRENHVTQRSVEPPGGGAFDVAGAGSGRREGAQGPGTEDTLKRKHICRQFRKQSEAHGAVEQACRTREHPGETRASNTHTGRSQVRSPTRTMFWNSLVLSLRPLLVQNDTPQSYLCLFLSLTL